MLRTLSFLISSALLLVVGGTNQALGTPMPSGSLRVRTVIDVGEDLAAASSMYNPRSFGGKNYVTQINSPQRGVVCYPAGSTIYEGLADIGSGAESRMACAFPAADYVLLAGGADNDYLSRIDPDLNLDSRVFATNLGVRPSSYDWVDDDTIIHNSYQSGLRSNLYLTDVTADPFAVAANTSWNGNGYATTAATTRIRNVRVGDTYSGYAYYGDAGISTAGFWAINLATGVSTQLGTLNVTGDGSWGLWTVKEVDGFLYVHTTHDGIYVYTMTDATTLGDLYTQYTKETLDALAEDTNPNWGFDVTDGGARMLLSAGQGRVIEIVDPRLATAPNPPDGAVDVSQTPVLSWTGYDLAAAHNVYFSENRDDVTSGAAGALIADGITETQVAPGQLAFETTYYWRVDEVNGAPDNAVFTGNVWSFTTEPFAYPVENIVATSNATSNPGEGPENTINGSGLDESDAHSTAAADMWLATPGADPTYIQYEFGRVYQLYEMQVWNYNAEFELVLGFGCRDVTVEYSADGDEWTLLGDVTFAQATAESSYLPNTTVDFQGAAARYVRLTVNGGFGANAQYGLSEVRFLYTPAHARLPQPADDATDVSIATELAWRAGRDAAAHEVSLGTGPDTLNPLGSADQPSYNPGPLDLGTTYYWRVDEVNEAEAVPLWEGDVWQFTTEASLMVDDFESYNNDDNLIYDAWIDGWINGSGSTVGYLSEPFAETEIVHSGLQSLPLFYDNRNVTTSEADLALDQDWTASGIGSLTLYFHGDAGNTAAQLYVKINDTRIDYDGPATDLTVESWQPWTFSLSAVADLASVRGLTIGIEGAGADGVLYIDDIELLP